MGFLKDALGYTSASTLGFLTGNMPGAVIGASGYKIYKNLTEPKELTQKNTRSGRMPQRRRRSNSVSFGRPTSRRRYTSDYARAVANSTRDPYHPALLQASGYRRGRRSISVRAKAGNNTEGAYKRSGKKIASKRKGAKKLKLSKRFKKAVKQVVRNYSHKGYYTERFFKRYIPIDYQQRLVNLGEGCFAGETAVSIGLAGNGTNMFFDPLKILDAASVLYKGKGVSGTKNIATAGQFSPKYFACDVLRQWVQISIKNNTGRPMHLRLWTWQLRNTDQIGADAGNQQFTDEWINTAIAEGAGANGKINVLSQGTDEIGMTPQLSPSMKKKFSMEEKEVVLEPGKTFLHYVQGPSMFYEFSKYFNNGLFNNYQNMCKGVCMAYYTDLSAGLTQPSGETNRFTDMVEVSGVGLLVETVYNYVIRLPDQAGFKLQSAALGSAQELDFKVPNVYAVKTWNKVAQNGTVIELNDESPGVPETAGI